MLTLKIFNYFPSIKYLTNFIFILFSFQKGKFSLTPPVSPAATSVNSFGSQNGGYDNNSYSKSFRKLSDDNEDGVDGMYRSIPDDVFTVSNGKTDTHKSRAVPVAKTGYENGGFDNRGSNFSENKYNWNESDNQTNKDNTKTKSSGRRICVTVLVCLIVLCICAGIAVILAYKVFDIGGKLVGH